MADRIVYESDILKKERKPEKFTLTEATKGTLFGAGCGVAGGLLFAKAFNKPYKSSAFFGMLIGGLISKIFI